MSLGKKNEQIAVDAAICPGKIRGSYTTAEIADFSDGQLHGETIPTGTAVWDSDLSTRKYYDGSAWVVPSAKLPLSIQIGFDVQVPISQSAVVFGTVIAPAAGVVSAVSCMCSAATDAASFMIQNLDLTAGAGNILSAARTVTNASEGTVVAGALHATPANLVVAKGDRFQVKITTDGSGLLDQLFISIDIDEVALSSK
ncbi:MAG: hypothetical protein JRF33_25270 [Deltaproteobacteria bacterium]|nr:hypothetical protein [Deltaproteobacteria bacterium]